jgi:hypothetical protein
MQILAGAGIAHLLEGKSAHMAEIAALATTCGYFGGLRQDVPIADIPTLARSFLDEKPISRRGGRLSDAGTKHNLPTPQQLEAIKAGLNSNQIAGAAQPLMESLDAIVSSLREISSALVDSPGSNRAVILRLQEETDILWWMFSGYSRDLERRFETLDRDSLAVLVGKELADLILVRPGPVSIRAIVARVIGATAGEVDGSTTIQKAISAVPAEWRDHLVGESTLAWDGLTPLHAAAKVSRVVGPEEEWASGFERAVGISARSPIDRTTMSLQMYYERILRAAFIEYTSGE